MIEEAVQLAQAHLPFIAAFGGFAVLGYVLAGRVFTVKRATRNGLRGGPWHWARELLPLGIILLGLLLGLAWQDPEGKGWGLRMSMAYFAFAAIASLPVVSIMRARGYKLRMWGDTEPP